LVLKSLLINYIKNGNLHEMKLINKFMLYIELNHKFNRIMTKIINWCTRDYINTCLSLIFIYINVILIMSRVISSLI